MMGAIRSDWVNEEYRTKLEEFATEQGVSYSSVEQAFEEHCATFRQGVADEATADVVRHLALQKLHWHSTEITE